MNLRRGFFRIWLVLSALYIIAVGALFYGDVSEQFRKAALGAEFKKAGAGILLVPVLCKEARGKDGEDYDASGPWNDYRAEKLCWYQEPKFRRLYPEYKDLTEDDLSDRLYQRAGLKIERAKPWVLVGTVAAIALSVPLAVFILGTAIGWAFAGFRRGASDAR
jgi:hypothetical protein